MKLLGSLVVRILARMTLFHLHHLSVVAATARFILRSQPLKLRGRHPQERDDMARLVSGRVMLSCAMGRHMNGKVALSLLILIRVVIVLNRGLKLVDIDVEDSVPARRAGPSREGAVTLDLVVAGV